jgi:hypothetical protein
MRASGNCNETSYITCCRASNIYEHLRHLTSCAGAQLRRPSRVSSSSGRSTYATASAVVTTGHFEDVTTSHATPSPPQKAKPILATRPITEPGRRGGVQVQAPNNVSQTTVFPNNAVPSGGGVELGPVGALVLLRRWRTHRSAQAARNRWRF